MPNHLHGIIVLADDPAGRGGSRAAPTPVKRKPLGSLVGAFKMVSTQQVNALRALPGAQLWQRDFYDHIIRDEGELGRIRQYIANNPLQWALDRENPEARSLSADEPWQV